MSFFDKLKNIAEDVGDTVSKGAKSAVDGSKKAIEKNKLKNQISKIKNENNNKFMIIGKKFFESNPNPSEEYAELFQAIMDNQVRLSELKAEINAFTYKYSCPNCNEGVEEGQKFCPNCGDKFETPLKKAETEEEIETVEAEIVDAKED